MYLLKWGLAVFFLNAGVPSAKAEMSVREFLTAYDQAEPQNKAILRVLLDRIETGFGWANSHLANTRKQPPIYCVPDKLALTGEQLIDILRRSLNDRPFLEKAPHGLALLQALRDTFPCQND